MLPAIKDAWRRVAMAHVSSSARDAIARGTLDERCQVVMNPDLLIESAATHVLTLSGQYHPPARPQIPVLGDFGRAAIENEIEGMRLGGVISDYDAHLARKVAYILTGGNVPAGVRVSEEYLLELERETFMDLCNEEKTRERIAHMLATGKPLRN
jgi:3-hydroxyacyl-CoA dehydrogenase